jgi:hypothetical protein
MSTETTTRTLEIQLKAAQLIRDQVAVLAGDDPDFIRDAVEGETSLFDIMEAMVAADGEDEALVDAIAIYAKKLAERKSRIEKRIDVRRALMASALEVAEIKKMETPFGTVAQKAVPPKLIVIEESEIPSRFFKPQAPVLDKKAILDALKDGEQITGAVLSNGSKTIQIRK